ncbi:MAG: RNA methyltransferase [Bacteroidetes bacterium]|nr:RNA methyltransferase [Bacteroidota bacterium]
MNPRRLEKFKRVVRQRQGDLTVILENVHDLHNIGAVMRSCDSVGIGEIFVLNTRPDLAKEGFKLGKRTSAGTRRWVDVQYYTDAISCFVEVRKKYKQILSSQIDEGAKALHNLDLSAPTALVFGNEHDGVTAETTALCDGTFYIPQVGMVESLNISVACAVSLYEAFRQRMEKGMYDENPSLSESEQEALLSEYIQRHEEKVTQTYVERKK